MPFAPDELYVGMIAYFTVNDLRRHPRIRTTNPTRDTKPRPFICYAQADGDAYWVALTMTANPQRRSVSRRWLRCPKGALLSSLGDLIVSDGRSSFAGPVDAFAECSHKRDHFKGMCRPMVLPEGVAEVQMIVASRRGLLPSFRVVAAAA